MSKNRAQTQKRGFSAGRVALLVLVGLMVAGYYFASPYVTVANLGEAIEEGDTDYVCERIDFEQVRSNLEDRTPPAGQPVVGSLLGAGVNCQSVGNALALSQRIGGGPEPLTTGEVIGEMVDRESTRFESPTVFSVRLTSEEAATEVRAVMSRTLFGWEVTDITFGDGQ